MRETKFRGLPSDPSVSGFDFVYGDFYVRPIIEGDGIMGYEHIIVDHSTIRTNHVSVIPETVGQFIGLKDKNGKEIYEGDIVNVNDIIKAKRLEEVKYILNYGFVSIHPFQDDGYHWPSGECEIIGNIHENKL